MRILIVKLSAIGDVVHTLPAAAYLKKALPGARVSWVVERRAAAILEGSPAIDDLIAINGRSLRKNPFAGRPAGFDIAIDFQGLIKSGLVTKASGAARRVGFETGELRESVSRLFLTEQVQTASLPHVLDKNLALARAVAASVTGSGERACSEYEFPISVSDDDEASVAERIDGRFERFVILNPGGGWATKLWGPARFAALADWLWEEGRMISLITFGPGEEGLAAEVASHSSANTAVPFPSTLKQFVALARRARLFVGGDTGPLHLAAACRTPIVGLYGPTSPERNGPFDGRDIAVGRDLWCRERCHRRACWHWECMEIPLAAVQQAVLARLQRAGKRGEDVDGPSPLPVAASSEPFHLA